jgi:hypothetical protein
MICVTNSPSDFIGKGSAEWQYNNTRYAVVDYEWSNVVMPRSGASEPWSLGQQVDWDYDGATTYSPR